MKKNLLFCSVLLATHLLTNQINAQTTPASATWQPESVSNVPGTVATSGDIQAFAQGGTLEAFQYSGTTNAVNDATGWQRTRSTSTAPQLPFGNAYDPNFYLEYRVKPADLKYLRVTSIKMSVLGGGTGNARLIAKYSLNGTTFSDMPVTGNYFLADGTAAQYAASETTPVVLVNTGATSLPEAQRTLTFSGLAINLDLDQTLYIRLYPYLTDITAPSSRYLMSRQVVVSAIASATTLPLDFLAVSAKSDPMGKSISINWQTTNEVNTKEFIIEKRTESTEFTAIGTKLSNNTAGTHHYDFVDYQVSTGINYYRLKQIDNDGKFKYSNITLADVKGGLNFTIYPNPTTETLSISHPTSGSNNHIKIYSLEGKNLLERKLTTGSVSTALDVSSLNSGTYLVVFEGDKEQSALKFIKK